MTTQGDLFGPPNAYGDRDPLVRRGDAPLAADADPPSSHEAAERHARTGKVKQNRAIALALVIAAPGSTGYELFARANDEQRAALGDTFELYRRLADIKNAGLRGMALCGLAKSRAR